MTMKHDTLAYRNENKQNLQFSENKTKHKLAQKSYMCFKNWSELHMLSVCLYLELFNCYRLMHFGGSHPDIRQIFLDKDQKKHIICLEGKNPIRNIQNIQRTQDNQIIQANRVKKNNMFGRTMSKTTAASATERSPHSGH